MKTLFTTLLLCCLIKSSALAEPGFDVSIPETYELANVILALTSYGRVDDWEVQKHTAYYNEVLHYFEPVRNHLLLQKVNYSRTLWEDYLSFRTDAVAYSFDATDSQKAKRFLR